MPTKKPTEMSDAELLKNVKLIKVVTIALITMCAFLMAMGLFLIVKKGAGFTGLMVVPLAMVPIMILNGKSLTELKKELVARNL